MVKKYIHVNQHHIKRNKKSNEDLPVITVKTYKDNNYAKEIEIQGKCKVIYRPEKPLPCGATVWIETDSEVVILR